MNFQKILAAGLLAFGFQAWATFIPENQIVVTSLNYGPSNMSEAEFRQNIARVQDAYSGVVSALGGQLVISGEWNSEKPNAAAAQLLGRWMIRISGGLARRPELTPDAFTLILCHELGHHLGGFAFAPPDNPLIGVWAANEGQSDYFATQVCARKLWAQESSINAEFRKNVKPVILNLCNQAWSGANDQDLCYRVLTAAESVLATMAALMGKPNPQMDTPDTSVVAETDSKHPAIQCRLDTSVQGALCSARHDERVIPGRNIAGGEFSLEAEQAAAANSCMASSGFRQGLRPPCWFKARL